jgi:hypothetical protein
MSERTPESQCKRLFFLHKIFSKVLVTDFYTYSEHTPVGAWQPW